MNTQQEYEYFDGDGQICQGNEEYLIQNYRWSQTSHTKGQNLEQGIKYRRPIKYFTKEYQAELAKQWVLEGGFEREVCSKNFKGEWSEEYYPERWEKDVFYRRKQQPTQEELDAHAAKEYSKSATIHTDATVIERAYMEGMKHERNRIK